MPHSPTKQEAEESKVKGLGGSHYPRHPPAGYLGPHREQMCQGPHAGPGKGLWAQSNSLPCKGQTLGFTAEDLPGPRGLHTLTGQSNRMRVPEESSVIIG